MHEYKIITICGSIKFKDEFMKVQEKLTLDGNIVLTPNFFYNIKKENIDEKTKKMLDEMHKQKIDMSDEIGVKIDFEHSFPAYKTIISFLRFRVQNLS